MSLHSLVVSITFYKSNLLQNIFNEYINEIWIKISNNYIKNTNL